MSFYRTTNSTGASCNVNLPITGHVDLKKGDFVWHLNTTNWIYFKSHDFFTFQSVLGPVWVRSIVTYSATWHMRPPKIRRWISGRLGKCPAVLTYIRKPEFRLGNQMVRAIFVSKLFSQFSKKNDSVITRKFCGHPLANIARVAWMTNFTKF